MGNERGKRNNKCWIHLEACWPTLVPGMPRSRGMPADNICSPPESMPFAHLAKLWRHKSLREVSAIKEQQGLFCNHHTSVTSPLRISLEPDPWLKLNKEMLLNARRYQSTKWNFKVWALAWLTRLLTFIQALELPYCKMYPWGLKRSCLGNYFLQWLFRA